MSDHADALVDHVERDGVHRVTLASEHNRNALSLRLMRDLIDIVRAADGTPGCRAIVLDHRGPVFCAGVDLVERRSLPPGAANHSEVLADLLVALWEVEAPLLARVDGAARGGGMGIITCCDAVVAGTGASFAYSEVKVGVAPALVGGLALATGTGRAIVPWLLSGRTFGPDEAARLGLVTDVADADGRARVDELIADLTLGGPSAQRATKRLVRRFTSHDVAALVGELTSMSAELFDTDEAREGMAAFAEKRRPVWPA